MAGNATEPLTAFRDVITVLRDAALARGDQPMGFELGCLAWFIDSIDQDSAGEDRAET